MLYAGHGSLTSTSLFGVDDSVVIEIEQMELALVDDLDGDVCGGYRNSQIGKIQHFYK